MMNYCCIKLCKSKQEHIIVISISFFSISTLQEVIVFRHWLVTTTMFIQRALTSPGKALAIRVRAHAR